MFPLCSFHWYLFDWWLVVIHRYLCYWQDLILTGMKLIMFKIRRSRTHPYLCYGRFQFSYGWHKLFFAIRRSTAHQYLRNWQVPILTEVEQLCLREIRRSTARQYFCNWQVPILTEVEQLCLREIRRSSTYRYLCFWQVTDLKGITLYAEPFLFLSNTGLTVAHTRPATL